MYGNSLLLWEGFSILLLLYGILSKAKMKSTAESSKKMRISAPFKFTRQKRVGKFPTIYRESVIIPCRVNDALCKFFFSFLSRGQFDRQHKQFQLATTVEPWNLGTCALEWRRRSQSGKWLPDAGGGSSRISPFPVQLGKRGRSPCGQSNQNQRWKVASNQGHQVLLTLFFFVEISNARSCTL